MSFPKPLQHENVRLALAFIVGASADLLDWFNPAFLAPVIGDPFDIITIAALFYLLRDWRVSFALLELAPFGDILPFYTGVVFYIIGKRKIQRQEPQPLPLIRKKNTFEYLVLAAVGVVLIALVFVALPSPQFSLLP